MKKCARIISLLLCVALFLSIPSLAVSQSQIDALEDEREALRDQRDDMQAEIDALKSDQDNALAQKYALDAQNELHRQEIELIDEQIDIYTKLVEQKSLEVEAAQKAEDEQLEAYKKHVRAMEEDGSFTYLAIIFGSRNLSDLLSNIDMIKEIMQADKRLHDQYIAAREETEQVKAEYELMLGDLEEKQDELVKAALELEIEAANKIIAELEALIEVSREAFDAVVAQEAALQSQIENMIAELERQEAANSITSTGTYIWPLPGYSPGSAYGWRMHPIYHEMRFHSGEDIGAPGGTSILAADSGVVTIGPAGSGYGNYVLVNHGGGRVTLYAHMSAFNVTAGQSVSQGDVIGFVGTTGTSTGNHLHFEVRVNGATTDPKQYFNFG